MKKYYFLIVFLLALSIKTAGAENGLEAGFISSFSDYNRIFSEVAKNFPSHIPLKVNGLKKIKEYDFKSKKPIADKPGVYLRFSFSSYNYLNSNLAREAFNFYKEEVKNGFYKSPRYMLLQDHTVYVLDGACLYSSENWGKIETILKKTILGKKDPEQGAVIKIRCGGAFSFSD